MNREFFSAHRAPLLFIFFVENGPKNMITVDELGHIFVWSYVQELVTSKQRFEPAHKYRLELRSSKYVIRVKETRIFPPPGQKEHDLVKPITT
jgi:hypothetical protein